MAKPKQPRKEVVSFRLEPKIKYLVDIAARVQRRSPTNYIEYILEESLKNVEIEKGKSIYNVAQDLWATDEPQRIIKLILNAPNLLTFEEEKIAEILRGYKFELNEHNKELGGYYIEVITEDWEIIKNAANDDKESILWINERSESFETTIWDLLKRPNGYSDSLILDITSKSLQNEFKPVRIRDQKIKNIIISSIHNFLLDDSKEASLDNIDCKMLIDSWNLISMAPFAYFAKTMLKDKRSILSFVEERRRANTDISKKNAEQS